MAVPNFHWVWVVAPNLLFCCRNFLSAAPFPVEFVATSHQWRLDQQPKSERRSNLQWIVITSWLFSKLVWYQVLIKLLFHFLSPANEVLGKVMFLHLCVILFTGGGGLPTPLDAEPPGLDRPPACRSPGCRPSRMHTPWMQTLRGQAGHPGCRPPFPGVGQSPPNADPSDAHPYRVGQTPPGCRPPLLDTVNKWAVRILLECILVIFAITNAHFHTIVLLLMLVLILIFVLNSEK